MAQAQQAPDRQYQKVTEAEFDAFMDDLAEYEKKVPPNANELAYDISLPIDGLVVRIWSTIVGGASRSIGKDAIRTVVWDLEQEKPIGGRKKTLRLGPTASNPEGWKGNLRPKIQDLVASWRRYDRLCPDCGSRMARREPNRGDDWDPFWSCTNYPACETTA